MGYPYFGKDNSAGIRIHNNESEADKKLLTPLTVTGDTPGLVRDFLPLYDILLRVFRSNISPCGGNADAIHGGLVNFLVYAHKVAKCDEVCERDHRIHEMHYIHEEL